MDFASFVNILNEALSFHNASQSGLTFYDLGSGAGRALFAVNYFLAKIIFAHSFSQAALMFDFIRLEGFELLHGLHAMSARQDLV